MLSWIWTLLTVPVLGSPASEWLLWWATFSLLTTAILSSPVCECSSVVSCILSLLMMPVLALQEVSAFPGKLQLVPAHDTFPWLSSL